MSPARRAGGVTLRSFANPAGTVGRAFSDSLTGIAPQSLPGWDDGRVMVQDPGSQMCALLLDAKPGVTPFGIHVLVGQVDVPGRDVDHQWVRLRLPGGPIELLEQHVADDAFHIGAADTRGKLRHWLRVSRILKFS